MRTTKKHSGFFMCLLINMVLNAEWSVPAWILLAMHFAFDWPLWPFFLALGLWLGGIILFMTVIGWAARCSSEPTRSLENKNPYSKKKDL